MTALSSRRWRLGRVRWGERDLVIQHDQPAANDHGFNIGERLDIFVRLAVDDDGIVQAIKQREPYVIRKSWDYFVRHLRGEEPPPGYKIEDPPG